MEERTLTAASAEAKKEAADLDKALRKRFSFVLISGAIAVSVCFGFNSGDFYGFCEIIITTAIFIFAVIRFNKKAKKLKKLKK